MKARPKPAPARRLFRWCGRSLVVVLLVFLGAFAYLNQVGVPNWLKVRLLAELHERGLDLEFRRLRVRLGRGIVAEEVRLRRTADPTGDDINLSEVQLKLGWSALLQAKPPSLAAVRIRGGQLTLPLGAEPGGTPYIFTVSDIQGRLRFTAPEQWDLEEFEARGHQLLLHATGSVTNVGFLRHREPSARPEDASRAWRRVLRRISQRLDDSVFREAPEARVDFRLDLGQPEDSRGTVELRAAGALTEFGDFAAVRLALSVNESAPTTNGLVSGSLKLDSGSARTEFGELHRLTLTADWQQRATNAFPDKVHWNLQADELETRWAKVARLGLRGTTIPASPTAAPALAWPWAVLAGRPPVTTTNGTQISILPPDSLAARWLTSLDLDAAQAEASGFTVHDCHLFVTIPHTDTHWQSVQLRLAGGELTTPWGASHSTHFQLAAAPARQPFAPQTNLAFWNRLAPVALQFQAAVSNLAGPRLPTGDIQLAGRWDGPQLTFHRLQARLDAGTLDAAADLDARSRRASFRGNAALDIQAFRPLMTPKASNWLAQFGWSPQSPPQLDASGAITLPPWNATRIDWPNEVQPTLSLSGRVHGASFTFRGIGGDSADGRFTYTNRVWHLPTFVATRPEGRLEFSYTGDERTQDYHFQLHSTIDPRIVRPLLETDAQRRGFDQVALGSPPELAGEVWGRWFARERTAARVRVAVTNLAIRDQPWDVLQADLHWTNNFLDLTRGYLRRGTNQATVGRMTFDAERQELFFTNTLSTLPVMSVVRSIGPKVAATMEPFVFATPPRVTIDGIIPTSARGPWDVKFGTVTPEFEWTRFHTMATTGDVCVIGQTLVVTNLHARFHDGRVDGHLHVDLSRPADTSFGVDLEATDVNLARMMAGVGAKTNRLDGLLSGHLLIREAFVSRTNSWQGAGRVRLKDGYLWDLPIFSVFSPLFDAVSPGLGQARFSSGTATFTLKNSVIHTPDLEVRSPSMRMQLAGSVDFNGRLDGSMQAELLRDVPLIGGLVNFALSPLTKIFEYRLRGTLAKPDAEPAYIPSFLLAPLHPIQTLKKLLPKDEPPAAKPAPPAKPTP